MPAHRTGQMDKLVSVQKYSQTRDAQGGFIDTWAEENQVWAKLKSIGAQERIDADQVKNVRTHRLTTKFYSPGITGQDRIVWNARTFHIVSVVTAGDLDCDTILDLREGEIT